MLHLCAPTALYTFVGASQLLPTLLSMHHDCNAKAKVVDVSRYAPRWQKCLQRVRKGCRRVTTTFVVGSWRIALAKATHRKSGGDTIAYAKTAVGSSPLLLLLLPTCHDTHRVGKSNRIAYAKVADANQ